MSPDVAFKHEVKSVCNEGKKKWERKVSETVAEQRTPKVAQRAQSKL